MVMGAAAIFAVAIMALFPNFTIDDAYITYRYAENLALHGELTYNIGEPRVEGCTGVALPLLLAGAIKTGLPPDPVSKALGIISYFLCAFFLLQIGRRLRSDPVITAAVVALYLTMPLGFTHALAGLETTLFSASVAGVLLMLIVCLQDHDGHPGRETLFLLSLVFASLVRPEGMVLAGLAVGALAARRWSLNHHNAILFAARALAVFILPLGLYLLWKWDYFGCLLPNSYYAKLSAGPNEDSINDLRIFWRRYMSFATFAALVLWIPPALTLPGRDRTKQRNAFDTTDALVVGAVVLFHVAVALQYARSQLTMNYSYRFSMHMYPAFLIGLLVVADRGRRNLRQLATRSRRSVVFVCGMALLVTLMQVYRHMEHLAGEFRWANQYGHLIHDEHIPAGEFLREMVPTDEWLVVHLDAGTIPYCSRLKTVDLGKLNDPHLARNNLTDEATVQYAFDHHPGAWAVKSRASESLEGSGLTDAITSDVRFSDYALVRKFASPSNPTYYQFIYLRKDLCHPVVSPISGAANATP